MCKYVVVHFTSSKPQSQKPPSKLEQQILRPHPPVRPHQDGLRRVLPLSGADAEAMRPRGDLGDGEDGGGLFSLLRRTGVEDEENCESES